MKIYSRFNHLDQLKVHDFLQITNNTKTDSVFGYNYQELGYQQGSPIWGMNPINPEVYPPTTVEPGTTNTTLWQTTTIHDTSYLTNSGSTQPETSNASFGNPLILISGLLIFSVILIVRRKRKE